MAWVDSTANTELLYEGKKTSPCKKWPYRALKSKIWEAILVHWENARDWLIQKQNRKTDDIWKWRISVKDIKQTNDKKEKIFKMHKTNKELLKINREKSNHCKRKMGKLILGSLQTMNPQRLSCNKWCLNSLMYREM